METYGIIGQDDLIKQLSKIINIFQSSDGIIRPHFILTGDSGSGKTATLSALATAFELGFIEINAAQLTKEGTSGNSLSKALSPLLQLGSKPSICFVDEFDKLFISGNSNSSCAHESTTGVQNEFLKVLESDMSSVYGDYGKYVNASTKKVLFVFAGAFNNEPNINIDRLREIGIKTEFLGRVGLVFNTAPLTLEAMYKILDDSPLLRTYIALFEGSVDTAKASGELKEHLRKNYENNTLGARLINTMIHQYFINGGLSEAQAREISFQNKLTL